MRATPRHYQKIELKLTGFARARPLLFSRTGLSNLLNKIQFTFEVVPCLILGLFRRFFHRCASILAQCYKGVSGQEAERSGEGGGKSFQVKTRDHQLHPDGPNHSTRPKGHHSGRGYWLYIHPIGTIRRCQSVGHGFTRL